MSVQTIVDRYRQPEYTGDNRCMACTIVNSIIGIVAGNLVLVALLALDRSFAIAGVGGLIVVLGSFTQIWLRGYLIPGTPTLTKRYLPAWLLAWFGKEPLPNGGENVHPEQQIDVEQGLLEAEAIQFDASGEDFELTPAFRQQWRETIDDVRDEELGAVVTEEFAIDGSIDVIEGEQSVRVRIDGRILGKWESRAALIADLGACRALATRYEGWETVPTPHRAQLSGGLRLYIETCPTCGGQTSFDTETATSCCNEYEVATVSCEDCGARLFEIPVDSVAR